jgi:hypothetical protein
MEDIYKQIEEAFNQSDIKKLAEKEGKKWYYSLCTNKPKEGQPLLIGLNWGASDEDFEPQDINNLPETINWSLMGDLKKLKPYLEEYFPGIDSSTYNQTNYCFFRSKSEDDLNWSDIKLTEAPFEEFISRIKPSIIFGFSAKLRDYLLHNRRILFLEERPINSGTKTYIVYKGFMKLKSWWTHINLIPHPSSWKYFKNHHDTLNSIWNNAKITYPYEYHFTDFLNYLESQAISPELSEHPLEGTNVREWLMDKDAYHFANLNVYNYASVMPSNFTETDITMLSRLINAHQGKREAIEADFRRYFKMKSEGVGESEAWKAFSKPEDFDRSHCVTRLSLQRFFIANTYKDAYRAYLEIGNKQNSDKWTPVML